MNRIEFEDALQAYESRFNSMEPELELTVRDPGLGVAVAARTMLEETGRSPSSATIAVQGVGAMGAAVCRYATEYGMTVRFIADPRIGGCWRIESEFDGPLAEAIVTMDFEAPAPPSRRARMSAPSWMTYWCSRWMCSSCVRCRT